MDGEKKDGRFTSESLKGNKYAKKDFKKEMAQHVASQELHWCADMVFGTSYKELKARIQDASLEEESLFTYMVIKKALKKGDFKAITFLTEMVLGKAKQQVETKVSGDVPMNFNIVSTGGE